MVIPTTITAVMQSASKRQLSVVSSYQLSAGYPALQLPEKSILSEYSNVNFKIYEGWDTVHGELITFADPSEIKPIDRLEGVPHYYQRVLVPVQKSDGQVIAAWVYTMDDINFSAQYLPDERGPQSPSRRKHYVNRRNRTSVLRQLSALQDMKLPELQEKWRDLYGADLQISKVRS